MPGSNPGVLINCPYTLPGCFFFFFLPSYSLICLSYFFLISSDSLSSHLVLLILISFSPLFCHLLSSVVPSPLSFPLLCCPLSFVIPSPLSSPLLCCSSSLLSPLPCHIFSLSRWVSLSKKSWDKNLVTLFHRCVLTVFSLIVFVSVPWTVLV